MGQGTEVVNLNGTQRARNHSDSVSLSVDRDTASTPLPLPVPLGANPDNGGHDRDAIEKFLRTLCTGAPGLVQTVRADGKDLYPRFHTTDEQGISEAVSRLDNLSRACAENSHLYLQISTCITNPNTDDQPDFGIFGRKRGGKDNVSHLLCLWNDIDYGQDGHADPKDGRLPNPPDAATAHEIYVRSGLPEASVIINSGGGLYELVLLDEPFDMTTPDGRKRAESVAKRWQQRIEKTAHEMGYHYGAGVSNADRVLRVPGTVNTKVWNNKRRATAHYLSEARYCFDDLEALINDLHPEPVPPARPDGGRITVERWNGSGTDHLPGTDFNNRGDWQRDILDPAGITYAHAAGNVTYWCRPGKTLRDGHSFSLDHKPDLLFSFTDGTTLPQWKYFDKFSAFTHLFHGGDFKAAAAELRTMRYGTALTEPPAPQPEKTEEERPAAEPASTEQATPPPATDIPDEPVEAEPTPPPPPDGPPAPPATGPKDDEPRALPAVDVTNERDGHLNLVEAISKGYIPEVYVREGRIVHVTEVSGTYTQKNETSTHQAVVLDASYMRHLVGQHMVTTKINAKDKPVVTLPTKQLCDSVLAKKHWPTVPHLRDVIGAPFVRADGTVCQENGYDAATGMWLTLPPGLRHVPENPTKKDIAEALKLIFGTVLRDFPWVSRADRANYGALLLTPMLRDLIDCNTPLGLITAAAPSSGKSLLTDLIACIHGGRMTTLPKQDEELEKKITTFFMKEMVPTVTFDNIGLGHTLNSPILAQLLTQRVWDGRVLGRSESIARVNDKLWMVTGNNLQINNDMRSRSLLVHIDPRVERPDERDTSTFAVGNLDVWMRNPENKARMVWALLVLVRSWAAAGMPRSNDEMRTYTPWAQTLGGLLHFHGIEGFRENKDELEDADEEKAEWSLFMEIWTARHGDGWVTASQLLADYQTASFATPTGSPDPWQGAFPLDRNSKPVSAKGLGKRFAYYKDRPSDGLVLRHKAVAGRAALWRVERLVPATVPEPRNAPEPGQQTIPSVVYTATPAQRADEIRGSVDTLVRTLTRTVNGTRYRSEENRQ